MDDQTWRPEPTEAAIPWPKPPMITAIGRGLLGRCPACGKTHMFNGFLKVVPECTVCSAPLGLARADDAPPYFTIFVSGHVIIPLLYLADRTGMSLWVMTAIFIPLTLIMTLGLIRPIKGGTVGLMLTLNMLKADPLER